MSSIEDLFRKTSPQEEALGIYLKHEDIFRETHSTIQPEAFREYEWLFQLMRKVHRREGYTTKGLIDDPEFPLNRLPQVRAMRDVAFNENRIGALLQQMRKGMISEKLRILADDIRIKADQEDSDAVLRFAKDELDQLTPSDGEDVSDPSQDVDRWYMDLMDIVDDPSKGLGLMTGILPLDKITGGLFRQHLSVVGGYTSMGKTALIIEIMLRLNKKGYKGAMFSLEMSKRDLYNRMMANLSGSKLKLLRTGRLPKEAYAKMIDYKEEMKTMYVDDTRGLTTDQICDKIKFLKRKQGLDFVIVDYLQDVVEKAESNDNNGSALGRVTRKLREAAQKADVHIIALSQISRSSIKGEDKRPNNGDLAGSTGIETAADLIMLIYRDEYFHADTNKPGVIEINVTKQRNGGLGKVELNFDKDTQRMTEMERANKP